MTDALFLLKLPVAEMLLATFYLLCVGQSLHVFFLASRRDVRMFSVTIAYEILLVIHLCLMAGISIAAATNNGVFTFGLGAATLPLEQLMWLNTLPIVLGTMLCYTQKRPAVIVELVVLAATIPPVIGLFGPSWVTIFVFDATFFLFRVLRAVILDVGYIRSTVTKLSVIEAISRLPEGILCANEQGRVLLMNDSMRSCLSALDFPTDLADARELWSTLRAKAIATAEVGELFEDGVKLWISDDEARLFVVDKVTLRKQRCQRIIAFDITEEERLDARIKSTSRLLEITGNELRASMDNLRDVEENEAILRMWSHVHDVIGQRLSILHRYLEDDSISDESLEMIKELINSILEDFAKTESLDSAADLEAMVTAFSFIDVAIVVDGQFPTDSIIADAFVRIVREATTNAVRHAQASSVFVEINDDGYQARLTISNNGMPCSEVIHEGTGLPGMRQAMHDIGGTLEVQAVPSFALRAAVRYHKPDSEPGFSRKSEAEFVPAPAFDTRRGLL